MLNLWGRAQDNAPGFVRAKRAFFGECSFNIDRGALKNSTIFHTLNLKRKSVPIKVRCELRAQLLLEYQRCDQKFCRQIRPNLLKMANFLVLIYLPKIP